MRRRRSRLLSNEQKRGTENKAVCSLFLLTYVHLSVAPHIFFHDMFPDSIFLLSFSITPLSTQNVIKDEMCDARRQEAFSGRTAWTRL